MSEAAILPVLFTLTGLLLAGLAVPLIARRVKPNGLYGLRVAATFADESVWYEANARSGRDLLVLGVLQVALALFLPLAPNVSDTAYALINATFLVVAVVFIAIAGTRRAERLLRERP